MHRIENISPDSIFLQSFKNHQAVIRLENKNNENFVKTYYIQGLGTPQPTQPPYACNEETLIPWQAGICLTASWPLGLPDLASAPSQQSPLDMEWRPQVGATYIICYY